GQQGEVSPVALEEASQGAFLSRAGPAQKRFAVPLFRRHRPSSFPCDARQRTTAALFPFYSGRNLSEGVPSTAGSPSCREHLPWRFASPGGLEPPLGRKRRKARR